jgi:hypothetical protein
MYPVTLRIHSRLDGRRSPGEASHTIGWVDTPEDFRRVKEAIEADGIHTVTLGVTDSKDSTFSALGDMTFRLSLAEFPQSHA